MRAGERGRSEESALYTEGNPCSGCPHASRCRVGLLACEEFERYLGGPSSSPWPGPRYAPAERFPTRELYHRLHRHNPTRSEREWRKVARARLRTATA